MLHKYNVNEFQGENKPTWEPTMAGRSDGGLCRRYADHWVIDNALTAAQCGELIEQFDQQPTYSVSVNGMNGSEEIGSWRAMAWADDLAEKLSQIFNYLPFELEGNERSLWGDYFKVDNPLKEKARYFRLGSTPWMRFMRYYRGGKHVPHYDSSFINDEQNYRTLFSWVAYLNDLERQDGGTFDFVRDRDTRHVGDRTHLDDWPDMAGEDEITARVRPRGGTVLMFPHWLCHQVSEYVGSDVRYIIRGDVAYGRR